MGTPIQPGDLTFKTREYYLNGGSDSAKGSTLTFQELDTTLIFLSNSIANAEGGPGTPAGPNQSIQFNSGSNFSGSSNFTFDYNNNIVNLTGSLIATSFTGSLQGSASYAGTSSISDRTFQIDVHVLNNSGYNIAKGKVVRISGATNQSDVPRIVTASYENDNNSANTLGITTAAINNGANGFVITEGILTGIDTSDFVSGQLIYLGATGSITGSAPVAPLHAVRLGEVIREQSNNGSIYVRIDNGYEIEELHDVKITSPTTGDLLIRSSSVWINSKQLTGSYGLTGSLAVSNSLNVVGTGSVSGSFIVSGSLVINPNGVGSQLINSFLLGRTSSAYAMQTTGSFALGTGGSGTGGNGGFSYDASNFPTFTFRNPGGDAGLSIKTNMGAATGTAQAIIRGNVATSGGGIALSPAHTTDSTSNHLVIASSSLTSGSASIGIGTFTPSSSLHVFKGPSGLSTAFTSPENIVISVESDNDNYINFRSANNRTAGLAFSVPVDNTAGYITYNNNSGRMNFSAEKNGGYHTFLTGDTQRIVINSDGLQVTGSISVTGSAILTLTPQNPLPSGVATGSFAVSSSIPAKPYFWDGSTWQALY